MPSVYFLSEQQHEQKDVWRTLLHHKTGENILIHISPCISAKNLQEINNIKFRKGKAYIDKTGIETFHLYVYL